MLNGLHMSTCFAKTKRHQKLIYADIFFFSDDSPEEKRS